MSFPPHFVWGAATAAYQVEGGAEAHGRGPSVWDMFCRKPGAVFDGHTGDIACDHYHRYLDDVAIMQSIGLKAYRLSVSWSRVLPEGVGAPNSEGLSFYDRLIDALLAAGIEPYVTLFHWDLPLALYHRGGWLNRDIAEWFADYASVVVDRLGDRVRHWITLNEPQVFIEAGLHVGRHAPGDKLRLDEVLRASHHALLAHGKAVCAIRAAAPRPKVGAALVGVAKIPATSSPADLEAARLETFAVPPTLWNNAWWMDPIYFGEYPEDGLRAFGASFPTPTDRDLDIIRQPLDFFGANIYHGEYVRSGEDGRPERVALPAGHDMTAMNWPVTPEAMYFASRFFYERYGKPIVITENGLSCRDWVSLDGKVHDPQRIDYVRRYLLQIERAIDDGVPVSGYFHWSFIDNFEWAEGYKERFGLVYCDYRTQKRIMKDSASWYADVIRSHGASLHPNGEPSPNRTI
jgi:beta-glucosidase